MSNLTIKELKELRDAVSTTHAAADAAYAAAYTAYAAADAAYVAAYTAYTAVDDAYEAALNNKEGV